MPKVPKVPKIEKKKGRYESGGMVAIRRIRSQLHKPKELNKSYKRLPVLGASNPITQ
jgi:hypothetical protein